MVCVSKSIKEGKVLITSASEYWKLNKKQERLLCEGKIRYIIPVIRGVVLEIFDIKSALKLTNGRWRFVLQSTTNVNLAASIDNLTT